MTRDEILAIEPGRELDVLVAEKVMRWKPFSGGFRIQTGQIRTLESVSGSRSFHPSTDISAAWEVRQRIHETIGGTKIISVCDEFPEECQIWDGRKYISVRANTVPEAICKAALLAVLGGETE